ncbi:MAG: phosphopantetheine-binding protein [Oscillospiraceae bacterium]|nr:phosphopantetheine-binding protein [Oscillospiraceae bacterium]
MIEEKIRDFFIEKHKADGLADDTDLFKGGIVDSLFAFEMVVYLEDTFGVRIPDQEITENNFRTILSIAAMIRRIQGV